MKVLTVKQPWAALIIRGDKDIENRSMHTRLRERIAIQAGITIDPEGIKFCQDRNISIPHMEFGKVIGSVEIVDSVTKYESIWWRGPKGYILKNSKPCQSFPIRGMPGFFELPSEFIPLVSVE